MKSPQRILALAALAAACVVSLQAHADQCRLPPAPSKIPDGSTASQQEMGKLTAGLPLPPGFKLPF